MVTAPPPTQPSNKHVIEQAEKWGWVREKMKRGLIVMRSLEGDRIDLNPPSLSAANKTARMMELYRKTGVTRTAFWAGPDKTKERDIIDRQNKPKHTGLTQSVGDALADAVQEHENKQPRLGVPVIAPARTLGARGGVNNIRTVTPENEAARAIILEAAKMPKGPTIVNQIFVALAHSGTEMSAAELQKTLSHLDYGRVVQTLSKMARKDQITRVRRATYQTKVAPVKTVETAPARPRVRRLPRPAPRRPAHTETAGCLLFVEPPAEPKPEPKPETVTVTVPLNKLDKAALATTTKAPRTAVSDADIDELLDLLFPNGFTFKARHLAKIEAWKQATHELVRAITEDN